MFVVRAMDFLSWMLVPDAVTVHSQDFAAVPTKAKSVMALGWFLATLIGGLLAARVTRWAASGWIVAGLILTACVYNGFTIPGVPLWMQITGVVAPFLGGLIVSRVSKPA
jgi:Na+/proline symporter